MTALQCRFLAFAWVASVAFGEMVETLTSENFKGFVENSDISLVKFYAPWCGHCRAMVPAYEEAARSLAVHSISLGKVDCTEETALASQNAVAGYPTLKVFRRGVGTEYTGPRDAQGIVKTMLAEREATAGLGAGSSAPAATISDADSPLLMAKLCRDQKCDDPAYPIMEYVEETKKCGCAVHPCWDDNGQVHSCNDPKNPHLAFNYDKDGKLTCGCKPEPHHSVNKYIGLVKCPGHSCETPAAPLLDWHPDENKCVCRAQPCDSISGVRHSCKDPKNPLINYREESAPDGRVKQVCECQLRFQHKGHDEL